MREWWRAGLPGAVSIRAFGAVAPLVLVVAALLAEGSTGASWWAWFSFAAAAFVAAIIVAQVISRWVRQRFASLNRGVTVVLVVLVGPFTISGALVVGILAGVPVPPNVTVGLLESSLLLATWLLVGGRLGYSLAEDAQQREELLREVAREKALALESSRLVEVDRQRLVEDVRGMVTERLVATHGDGGNPGDAAAHLRALVNDAVRPLSHELHNAQVREDELVDQVAMMRIPRAAALWAKPRLITRAENGDSLLAAALVGAGVVSGLTAISLNVGVLWASFPAVYSLGLAVVLLLANVRTRDTRAKVSEAFRAADRASALVRQAAWVTRRRLANTMHGEVQGRILASALRLPSMSAEQESEELETLQQDLHRILGTDDSDGDWRVAWDRLIEMWEYSIELTVEGMSTVGDQLSADPVAGAALVAVVSEAATNAVRHGRAQQIQVRMSTRGRESFAVVVEDDGSSTAAGGEPSLGSSTLDAVTLEWRLDQLPRGHRLEAVIPVRDVLALGSLRENSEHSVTSSS